MEMIIAGEVLDWSEAEEIESIAKVFMLGQRIRELSKSL
jgi:hypothetical protein